MVRLRDQKVPCPSCQGKNTMSLTSMRCAACDKDLKNRVCMADRLKRASWREYKKGLGQSGLSSGS